MELHVIAHVLLGGLFTFLLLRELCASRIPALIAATVFQCGPYFTSQTQHLGAMDGAAWIPLACLGVVRLSKSQSARWTAILALSLALSLLAGFPSTAAAAFLATFALAAVLVAARKSSPKLLLRCSIAAALGILLSAVQLLPTMQVSSLSVSKFRGDFRGTSWGVPWPAFVSMLWPDYYHVFELNQYHLPWNPTFLYLYCGIPALILTAIALVRRSRYTIPFAAVTLVGLFSMMGTHTWPGHFIFPPVFDLTRDSIYLEFTMVIFAFGIAVLAGLGAEAFARKPGLLAAILAVAFIDLAYAGSGKIMNANSLADEPGITRTAYAGHKELIDWIRQRLNTSSPPARFDLYNDFSGWVTTNPITLLPTSSGNDPFALYRFMQVRLAFCRGERWGRFYMVSKLDSPVLDLLNVRLMLSMTPAPSNAKFIKAADLAGRIAYENAAPLPRFFLVARTKHAADLADAALQLKSDAFDPRQFAIVEETAAAQYPDGPPGNVRVIKYEPTHVALHVETPSPRFLVTSEVNYPGWRAWIDGQEQPIMMTNVAFRGLPVPAGSHEIEFRFWPLFLGWSAAISAAAAIALIALLGRRRVDSSLYLQSP